MVTAGIYMIARSNILFTMAPATQAVVAVVGLATAVLAATIALMRTGINTFWVSLEGVVPAIRWVEVAAIVMLLGLGLIMTVYARPVMTFMAMAADALYTRGEYVQAVLHDSTAGVHQ
jgi:hypothetical protein